MTGCNQQSTPLRLQRGRQRSESSVNKIILHSENSLSTRLIPDSEFGDVDFNYPSQPTSVGELLLTPEGSELRIEMLRILMGPRGEKGEIGERGPRGESYLISGERRTIPIMQNVPAGWIETSAIVPTIVSILDYPALIGVFPQTASEEKLDMAGLIASGDVVITDSGHFGSRDGTRLFDGSSEQHVTDNLPGEYHTLNNIGEDSVRMKFSSPVKIVEVRYTQRIGHTSEFSNFRLRYSEDDAASWVDLKTSTLTVGSGAVDVVDYRDVAVASNDYSFAFFHNGYMALGEAEIWVAGVANEDSVSIPAIPVGAHFKTIVWGGRYE